MERLTLNLTGGVRSALWRGREWWVAPASSINPGVLNGSKGPLYYPSSEIRKGVPAWDNVPIVVYHPIATNGEHISATDPRAEPQKVGLVRGTKFDTKLRHELWFDKELTRRVDPRVAANLEAGTPMELSTGLYTDNEDVSGVDGRGRAYTSIARNHRPDHMAILPDQVGACSRNDGCGVLVNANPNHDAEGKFSSGDAAAAKEAQLRHQAAHEHIARGMEDAAGRDTEHTGARYRAGERIKTALKGKVTGEERMYPKEPGGKGELVSTAYPPFAQSAADKVAVDKHAPKELAEWRRALAIHKNKRTAANYTRLGDAYAALTSKAKSVRNVYVENPAVSEAQRRYLNTTFGHDWVKEHHFDNHGKLPETVDNDDEEETPSMNMFQAAGQFFAGIFNASQPRHPVDGKFQGKPHVSVKRGFTAETPADPGDAPTEVDGSEAADEDEVADDRKPVVPASTSVARNAAEDCPHCGDTMTKGKCPCGYTANEENDVFDILGNEHGTHPLADVDRAQQQAAFAHMGKGGGVPTMAAKKASSYAKEKGTAQSHRYAAQMHSKAAAHHDKGEGQKSEDFANAHRAAAKEHTKAAAKAEKTSNNALAEIISNCSCEATKQWLTANAPNFSGKSADPKTKKRQADKEDEEDEHLDDSVDNDPEDADDTFEGTSNRRAVSADEWMRTAPPEVREVFQAGSETIRNERKQLVARLTANLSAEDREQAARWLSGKSRQELRAMAYLVPAPVSNAGYMPSDLPTFGAQLGGVAPAANSSSTEDLLDSPTLNFAELAPGVSEYFKKAN